MTQTNDIWVVTDSNSGITAEEAKKLDIGLVSMPFTIDGKEYFENESLKREDFFKSLKEDKTVSTSQPPVGQLIKLFEEGLKQHESIVYIPMSSALSGSCMTAQCLSTAFAKKVQTVDNLRISCTQKQSVLEAINLARNGYSAEGIKKILEDHKKDASIYMTVENTKYLKNGGRSNETVEAAVSGLSLKPVLQIQGEKIDYFCRARGLKSAQKKMLEAVSHDMTHRFFGKDVIIKCAFAEENEESEKWLTALQEYFPAHLIKSELLPLSVCCHTGPSAFAAACMKKLPEAPFFKYEI